MRSPRPLPEQFLEARLLFRRQFSADSFTRATQLLANVRFNLQPGFPRFLLAIADDLLNAFPLFWTEFKFGVEAVQKISPQWAVEGNRQRVSTDAGIRWR